MSLAVYGVSLVWTGVERVLLTKRWRSLTESVIRASSTNLLACVIASRRSDWILELNKNGKTPHLRRCHRYFSAGAKRQPGSVEASIPSNQNAFAVVLVKQVLDKRALQHRSLWRQSQPPLANKARPATVSSGRPKSALNSSRRKITFVGRHCLASRRRYRSQI
jgi:hypothetical protein